MATFGGIAQETNSASSIGEFVDNQEHNYVELSYLFGPSSEGNVVVNQKSFSGIAGDTLTDTWFDNIIVEPVLIDFEFIADNIAREFTIISTFRRHEDVKTMSLFNELNFEGLQSLDVVTPKQITAQCEELFTLIALKDGPATQTSQIVIQIDGTTYTIDIKGLRVALFPFLPDRADEYIIAPIFKTAISRTSNFVEQRRAIHSVPILRNVFNFFLKKVSHRNILRQLSKQIVGMPIHVDFIRVDNITNDLVSNTAILDTTTNLDELTFLDNARFVCFINEDDVVDNEVVEIDSFTTNQINLKKNVDIAAQNLRCFPIFLGEAKVQNEQYQAPILSAYNVVCEEI